MFLEIYNILKNLEKDFNNKYEITSLSYMPEDNDFNKITIKIKHTEMIARSIEMLKLIDELILELDKKGLKYKQGGINTSEMQVSDVLPGGYITNETTENVYYIEKL